MWDSNHHPPVCGGDFRHGMFEREAPLLSGDFETVQQRFTTKREYFFERTRHAAAAGAKLVLWQEWALFVQDDMARNRSTIRHLKTYCAHRAAIFNLRSLSSTILLGPRSTEPARPSPRATAGMRSTVHWKLFDRTARYRVRWMLHLRHRLFRFPRLPRNRSCRRTKPAINAVFTTKTKTLSSGVYLNEANRQISTTRRVLLNRYKIHISRYSFTVNFQKWGVFSG
jgi:hypothetical protein